MSCKVFGQETKQRCPRRFRDPILPSRAEEDTKQKENKRTKWEHPKKEGPTDIKLENSKQADATVAAKDDDDENNTSNKVSIENVGIKMLRESSCLLPPSQPIILRSGKKEDISRETMVTPNRTTSRQDGTIRKTMIRSGERKTRSAGSNTDPGSTLKKSGESGSECGSEQQKEVTSESEVVSLDIFDDSVWDTDLEAEDIKEPYDHTGRSSYINRCRQLGVTPISYFLRHMKDKELDLRYHGLGSRGARAVTPTIATSCHIHKLDLTDNNLSRSGGLALCDMIQENCFISELVLSSNKLNLCIWDLCDAIILNDSLTHLTLSDNDFNDYSAPVIAKLIRNAKKLEHLDLSHNKFESRSGKVLGPALSENATIKHLNLSWNNLRSTGFEILATGIKGNCALKHLDLSWNGIDRGVAKVLGEALKSNNTLEYLDISNCRVNPECSVLIGLGLSCNEILKEIKMVRNPMESAGCYAICAAVLRNPKPAIEKLNFQHSHVNEDFHDLFEQLKEKLPDIKVIYGNQEAKKKPKAMIHPMALLVRYLDDNNIRLADCFGKFDEDGSMTVTHEEFIKGIESIGLRLDDVQKTFLLNEMDRDGDGEIDYSELVRSRMEFKAKANSAEYLFPKMIQPTS